MRYPEAGGSASFARHAFNELVSFGAAWAQMLNYVITVAISVIFVPHYLSIFWEPLRTNPWDIIVGICLTWLLVGLNVIGIQEAAKLNILLAVVDFATQLLLVALGFFLIFSPQILVDNVHLGVAPTWSAFVLAIPVAMIAYTGIETVSNLAEEARDPVRSIPRSISWVAIAVFAIYFTLPWIALSAMPVEHVGQPLRDEARPAAAARLQERPGARPRREHGPARRGAVGREDLRRHPRCDDPVHRHERRRDRRVADHLLDVELPPAAGGVPQAAPQAEDAVALARRLRGNRPDALPALGAGRLPGADVRVRRHALVHDRPSGGDDAPRAAAGRGARVARATEPDDPRHRSGRCSRSSGRSGRAQRGSSSSSRTRRRGTPVSPG